MRWNCQPSVPLHLMMLFLSDWHLDVRDQDFIANTAAQRGCAVIARWVGTGAVRLRELGGLMVVSGPSQGASSMETQLAEQDSHQSTNKRQAGLCLHRGRTVTRRRQPIASPQWPILTNGPFLQPITGEQPCCDIIR